MKDAIAAVARGAGSRAEVEHAARQLVTQLRGERQLPEQMLLQIKETMAEGGLRPTYASSDDPPRPDGAAAIYRDVIAWSIRYYYEQDGTSGDRSSDGR